MQAARPSAKQIVIAHSFARVLVGTGSATPPTQQPSIKNVTGMQPGGFLPGQFRVVAVLRLASRSRAFGLEFVVDFFVGGNRALGRPSWQGASFFVSGLGDEPNNHA